MVDGATVEQVHAKLKAAIMIGAISMHSRLDIAGLAGSLEVSTTPVREAAMRLWGAGLLEPHPKGGLRAVLATETRLRGLLDLHERLSAAALATASAPVAMTSPLSGASFEQRSRATFQRMAARAGNAVLQEAIDNISDRLAIFRHREPDLLPDVETELGLLEQSSGDRTRLRKVLRRYHRRRMSHATELVWAASVDPAERD